MVESEHGVNGNPSSPSVCRRLYKGDEDSSRDTTPYLYDERSFAAAGVLFCHMDRLTGHP